MTVQLWGSDDSIANTVVKIILSHLEDKKGYCMYPDLKSYRIYMMTYQGKNELQYRKTTEEFPLGISVTPDVWEIIEKALTKKGIQAYRSIGDDSDPRYIDQIFIEVCQPK